MIDGTVDDLKRPFSESKSIPEKRTFLAHISKWIFLTIQLALVLFTLHAFQIEKIQGLLMILPIIFFGFVIFHLLPFQFRLPFFFLLSCFALIAVLGKFAPIAIGIGLGVFSLCQLPLRRSIVIALLLIAGAFLAALQVDWIHTSWAHSVIPVIGSMFMFRMILYINELGKNKLESVSIWQRLCYFFLLPNVCFLVFPPVDYTSFIRSYELEDPVRIRQKGINWMVWGTLHLLLYRYIYYYWMPDPADIVNLTGLVTFLVTGYMVVLRICGQAYLAIGILCLFGFNLPPLFNNYLLSTGFIDFWRRTYIYWKDFVTRIFYYRIFFAFRKLNIIFSTAVTTLLLFLITWILHSYQFFWIKGNFPLHLTDVIFWNTFGLLVCINAILQIRRKNKKKLGDERWSFFPALRKSLCGVTFFCVMCFLWSLWGSVSVSTWLNTVAAGRNASFREVISIVAVFNLIVLSATFLQYLYPFRHKLGSLRQNFYATAFVTVAILSLMIGTKSVVGTHTEGSQFVKFIISMSEPRLNKKDMRTNLRGYYEPLLERERFTAQFSERRFLPDRIQAANTLTIMLPAKDLRLNTYIPSTRIREHGMVWTINRWGFRDKDYTMEKPPNVYRFAVVGGSIEVGSGVNDEEVFENLVENNLNKNSNGDLRYEVLNLSFTGNSLIQNLAVTKRSLYQFHPDVLLLFSHYADEQRITDKLAEIVNMKLNLEYPELREIVLKSGVTNGMERDEFARRLKPYLDSIFDWALETIRRDCVQHHVIPMLVLMPGAWVETDIQQKENLALRHGFHVIDLSPSIQMHDLESQTILPWDIHPNAEGHRLIAAGLYQKIREDQKLLGIQLR